MATHERSITPALATKVSLHRNQAVGTRNASRQGRQRRKVICFLRRGIRSPNSVVPHGPQHGSSLFPVEWSGRLEHGPALTPALPRGEGERGGSCWMFDTPASAPPSGASKPERPVGLGAFEITRGRRRLPPLLGGEGRGEGGLHYRDFSGSRGYSTENSREPTTSGSASAFASFAPLA